MIGMITSASRIEELNAKVAIIQPRLRVWILRMVSNVESSNIIAPPPTSFQPRLQGGSQSSNWRTRPGRSAQNQARGAEAHGHPISDHPIRNHCACVDTTPLNTVPEPRNIF